MKNTEHFLSLIIPVYKQQKTIVANIKKIKIALESIRYDYEILPIIDGTVDKSFQNIKKAHIDKVRCFAYDQNQGKSFAIRFGMHEAKGDYVMFIDAGKEIDLEGISMLLEHMEWYNADIIVGSKRHPASIVNYSFIRRILSYGYYFFVKVLFGIKVSDTQAGIKIFKKQMLEKVLPRLVEKKFAGDLEILVVARQQGFKKIYEAPIKLDYNLGKITSAANMKAIQGMFLDTLAIFYRRYFIHYYDKPKKSFTIPKHLKIQHC